MDVEHPVGRVISQQHTRTTTLADGNAYAYWEIEIEGEGHYEVPLNVGPNYAHCARPKGNKLWWARHSGTPPEQWHWICVHGMTYDNGKFDRQYLCSGGCGSPFGPLPTDEDVANVTTALISLAQNLEVRSE